MTNRRDMSTISTIMWLDLKQFHDQIIMADQPTKLFLLAHSMGGAISARYLERWPDDIQAAVLSSPMLGINLGGLPKWLAKGLAATIGTVGGWIGEPPYGPGQGAYQDHGFADNELTHSQSRYQAFRQIYEQHPQIKLGGVLPPTGFIRGSPVPMPPSPMQVHHQDPAAGTAGRQRQCGGQCRAGSLLHYCQMRRGQTAAHRGGLARTVYRIR